MSYDSKKITIQDVAKLANVSITTVSRVVNKNYPVSQNTKNKVDKAIKELDYNPNMLARGLIKDKTKTIGIITPSIENLFFSAVINAIDSEVATKGYDIFLCNTKGVAENERRTIGMLLSRSVDGIIAIDPRTENIKNGFYTKISDKKPTILTNAYNKQIDCNFVLNDERSGMNEAILYLMNLGHSEIAFLRGRSSYSYDMKEKIYSEYIMINTKLSKPHIIQVESGNEIETVKHSSLKVEAYLKKHPEVTAIIACNDWMAVGAIEGAKKSRLKVPEDLSVIGFDNTLISQISTPELTTIDHNMAQLGKASAKRLLEIIKENKKESQKIIIDTKLIKRNSCSEVRK